MAEMLSEVKSWLRSSIEEILSRLNDRMFEDRDDCDYLCAFIDRILNILARISVLFDDDVPSQIYSGLQQARNALSASMNTTNKGPIFISTGCRGRPEIFICKERLEMYLELSFSTSLIAKMFGVSSKTIQRRIADYGLQRKSFSDLSDVALDRVM